MDLLPIRDFYCDLALKKCLPNNFPEFWQMLDPRTDPKIAHMIWTPAWTEVMALFGLTWRKAIQTLVSLSPMILSVQYCGFPRITLRMGHTWDTVYLHEQPVENKTYFTKLQIAIDRPLVSVSFYDFSHRLVTSIYIPKDLLSPTSLLRAYQSRLKYNVAGATYAHIRCAL